MMGWSMHLRKLVLRALVLVLRAVYPPLDALVKRIRASPGVPVANPSPSYWTTPPSPISRHGSGPDSKLPSYADIVVIGSGITGTGFARTILDHDNRHRQSSEPLRLVMLEAREACSGATGRNGGHINPLLYTDYPSIKSDRGVDVAKQIIRFRLSHFPQILAAATEENLLEESQCRQVEALDVFYDSKSYQIATSRLATYRKELPAESLTYKCYEGADDIKRLQLSDQTLGCISTVAGAIHPYRFVTGILSRLLRSYASNFHLFTYTPCTAISEPNPSSPLYCLTTPKGVIQTPHVVHATNGWVSHLVPGMRTRILPTRGTMTAQKPPKGLGVTPQGAATQAVESWAGMRAFVFYPEASVNTFLYLTQQRTSDPALSEREGVDKSNECPPPSGELMLGGWMGGNGLTEVGIADDRGWNRSTANNLSHATDECFSVDDQGGERGDKAHMIAQWGGILGFSVDDLPWIGRIPVSITGRLAPQLRSLADYKNGNSMDDDSVAGAMDSMETIADSSQRASARLASPGEWMAAGYSGEGMVHAWMSAKALAYMVLGLEKVSNPSQGGRDKLDGSVGDWFPDVFRLTEERWENTGAEGLIVRTLF